MTAEGDLEDWIVDMGVELAERKASCFPVSPINDLIGRFWFVDYCMRNAGDLANLEDPQGVSAFLQKAAADAHMIGLPNTEALFLLSRSELERAYFDRFVAVCGELREACAANG